MSDPYLRLETAPRLRHPGNPYCGACDVEVDWDDQDWLCSSCGTIWPGDDMEDDGSRATMYPEWSGHALTGPMCRNDVAWRAAGLEDWPTRRPECIASDQHAGDGGT